MNRPNETRSENYLRFSRRRTTVLLLLVLAVGMTCVAMTFRPVSPDWSRAMVPLWIVAIVLAVGLQRSLGGDRWDPRAAEARAIVDDEWRRSNMDRARRGAFVVVLGAQLPLGLLLAALQPPQALMAMGAATVTLGAGTLLALFLYFDRDTADAG